MSHFIILTPAHSFPNKTSMFRVRANSIDWMADVNPPTAEPPGHTVVYINGEKLYVQEPSHVILDYIKDPNTPLQGEFDYVRNPSPLDYDTEKYCEMMHVPMAKK